MSLSIKKTIVLWYTLWMVMLASLIILLLISGSSFLVERRSRMLLSEIVHDAADDIEIEDGEVEIDDDIKAFDEGIYISIYDEDGTIMFGRIPTSLSSVPSTGGMIESVESDYGSWYVYDVEQAISETSVIRVRGVMRVQDMSMFFSFMEISAFIIVPLLAVLSSLGGFIIVSRSFRPAERVIITAGRIASGKDLSKRIGLGKGNGEIHQMAAAFDRMLSRLEEAFEKERQFSDDASHELRTPISVILAECGYARTHLDDREKMEESISAIENQASRMSRLISMLLSIARSDKGTLQPILSDVDVSELGQIVLETMEEKAADKDVRLIPEIEPSVHARADQDMLMAIMINLITNAINYNKKGGWCRLSVKEDGKDVIIDVNDSGIGISEKDMGRIWDRFFQADPARSGGGAGLGLPIVSILAQCHGGSVSAESREGEGSRFSVRIPKNP